MLVAGATAPAAPLEVGKVVARRDRVQATWRVHDHDLLPSLKDTNLLLLDGEYVEMAPLEKPLLTLIPPAMGSPPEKVWLDKVETTVPGVVLAGLAPVASPTSRGTSAGCITATARRGTPV